MSSLYPVILIEYSFLVVIVYRYNKTARPYDSELGRANRTVRPLSSYLQPSMCDMQPYGPGDCDFVMARHVNSGTYYNIWR